MSPIKNDFEDKGVEFVAVNVWEEPEGALAFTEKQDDDYLWARTDDASLKRLGIKSIPALIVVDQEGNVVWRSSILTFVRQAGDLRGKLEKLTRG
ncbi:MAG: hypothetical protein R3344_07960 [Acidobacteriota bacterium]|nr:hypothetical protein [Acidobacteriota bacterium]